MLLFLLAYNLCKAKMLLLDYTLSVHVFFHLCCKVLQTLQYFGTDSFPVLFEVAINKERWADRISFGVSFWGHCGDLHSNKAFSFGSKGSDEMKRLLFTWIWKLTCAFHFFFSSCGRKTVYAQKMALMTWRHLNESTISLAGCYWQQLHTQQSLEWQVVD